MLPIQVQIERAERLVRMLEQDAPRLANRVAELTPEYQQSARDHAAEVAACARAELHRLMKESSKLAMSKSAKAAH